MNFNPSAIAAFYIIAFVAFLTLLFLCWAAFRLLTELGRFIVKRAMLTEYIGRVAEHAYSEPRVEEEWLHSWSMFTDPITTPSASFEPPILVTRQVPALPYIRIQLPNGASIYHECTLEQYTAWEDGTPLQVNVYSLGGWTIHVSDPMPVA